MYAYFQRIHNSQKVETTHVSITRQRDNRVSVHTLEYYSAMKRSEALTPATAQVGLGHVALSERRQTQKATQGVIPFMWHVQNRHICRDRKWIHSCQGLGEGMRVTIDGDRIYVGVMECSGTRQRCWLHVLL